VNTSLKSQTERFLQKKIVFSDIIGAEETVMTKKIMIIDDEQNSLILSKAILSSAGYEVITESDSTRALQTVKEQMPDLVLMDVVMPTVNGVELAMKIKEDPALKTVHLFALTGMPMINEHNKKFFEKIILKPYHMEDLLKEMKKFFEKQLEKQKAVK
jgi:CheY-like chemotaxis protein